MAALFDFPITKIDKDAIAYWLVCFINFWIRFIDFFIDPLLGYSLSKGSRKEREDAEKDGRTVQLVQILMRGAYAETYTHTPDNFVYRHLQYVSPRYIVENDKATLHGLTKTHCFFCITTNPEVDVVDTRISPFMFALQFLMAEKHLIVPHDVMYKLADEIGDPKVPVTFLDMTGRCGSTLICTMMARVPEVRVFSEPWVFLHAQNQYVNKHINREQYRRLLRTIIRLLCRKENEKVIKRILIKLTIFLDCQIEVIKEVYPEYKFMFITRHYKPCVKSWKKLVGTLPPFFVNKRSIFVHFFFDHFPVPYDDAYWEKIRIEWRNKRGQPENLMDMFTMNYIGEMACMMKFKDKYHHRMLYEDVMADPDGQVKKVFDVMDVDYKHVETAKEAFNFDSQRGKFGGRGIDHIDIPDNVWKEVDALFLEYNMPFSIDMSMDDLRKIVY